MADQFSAVIDIAQVEVQALSLSMDVVVRFPDVPGQGGMIVMDAAPLIVTAQPPNAAQVNAIYLPGAPVSTGGAGAGDDAPPAKRIDFVSDTVFYQGQAAAGSDEGAPVWRIARIVLTDDGGVTTLASAGAYACAWADRATYTYE